jgi:tetratricopeptide (TPR) repeat protein
MTAFTDAIAAPDFSPVWLPQAYRFRAVVYMRENRCAEAFADTDKALSLRPGLADVLYLRAYAARCLKKYDVAIADLTSLVDAGFARLSLFFRGKVRWQTGDVAGAAADFAAYESLAPNDANNELWLAAARARAGLSPAADTSISANTDPGDDVQSAAQSRSGGGGDSSGGNTQAPSGGGSGWQGRLLALYAGTMKPDDILRTGEAGAPTAPWQKCQAYFFIGEWWLAKSDTASARPLLQSAADTCPDNLVDERDVAKSDLARLKG